MTEVPLTRIIQDRVEALAQYDGINNIKFTFPDRALIAGVDMMNDNEDDLNKSNPDTDNDDDNTVKSTDEIDMNEIDDEGIQYQNNTNQIPEDQEGNETQNETQNETEEVEEEHEIVFEEDDTSEQPLFEDYDHLDKEQIEVQLPR